MIPVEKIKHIKIPKHIQFRGKDIDIEVPDKLRPCQRLAARAVYENALLRAILQEKMQDEKDYQETILELDKQLDEI